ncbi:acetolactate synthase-1/2/3 large subunit [Palleronia aestuarii]|uniref:Acetolactate synthase-1/2/3 large subunit n=1 Tax=Palleronia aestuarii TaxID=568105 RepID=A0A2W7QBC1_9RHOB|nr:acetolactate synthase large subunit [Palleronia aestuarii]PZX19049.1 acetolactate synthase-1/2/3 large subunit [Palleronia aestuarii]
MNGAESVVRSLHAAGVEVCFANPGTSEMQFVDALDRTRLLRCVLGLFEGVVTGAADGYARMAGKPGVSLLHLAPGLANAGANLHNARKARTPMITLVGDHAVRHRGYDAPLTADVAGAAAPFADWVDTARSSESFAAQAMEAYAAATGHPGQGAVLIAPADLGWDEGGVEAGAPAATGPAAVDTDAVERARAALAGGERTVILAGGSALEDHQTLARLQGIAAATGAVIMAPTSNRRIERGGGRADIRRLPYPIDLALETLAPFTRAILVETQPPVAFFAYPGKPSLLLPEACEIVTLAGIDGDGPGAIAALADIVGAAPRTETRVSRPEMPGAGPITPEALAAALAHALPEGAIVVDESITAGRALYDATSDAAETSWLAITGGAIGIGPPLATGAAVACPDRPVIAMQADGSAMYTIQALWTQAREGLNVTTVILSNRAYEILKGELRAVGSNPGPDALAMLNLDRPELDFVSLARGMGVPGRRVEDARELMEAIRTAASEPGPFLIEAAIAG